MKNQKIILFIGILLMPLFVYLGCEKQAEIDETNAPNAIEMKDGMGLCNKGVMNKNGLLEFKDEASFYECIKCLEQEVQNHEVAMQHIPDDFEDRVKKKQPIIKNPVLDVFEKQLQHKSLRKKLEQEEEQLLLDGSFDETNDPDNHFIADPMLRVMFNEQLELKVGDHIVKYMNEKFMIDIPDGDFQKLHQIRTIDPYDPNEGLLPYGVVVVAVRVFPCNHYTAKTGTAGITNDCFDCDADFDFSLDGLTLTFTNNSTSNYQITRYEWDFGDGVTSNQENPAHTYAGQGNYTISLTVYDAIGCSHTFTNTINLTTTGHVGTGGCNPDANFEHELKDDRWVHFADKSAASSGHIIISWRWEFGDGNFSTEVNPMHQYAENGCYSVTLTIADDWGCSDTETKQVGASNCTEHFQTGWDKEKWKEYETDRKFKGKVWQANIFGYHKFGSTTKNYWKRWGVWYHKKAHRINATIVGEVWGAMNCGGKQIDCTNPLVYPLDIDAGNDAWEAGVTINVNIPFWSLKTGSIFSTHAVFTEHSGVEYEYNLDITLER